ncbi:MAG: phosphoglucosamine mutase, partial [Prevotellaceae bacterium]|nr:phosphoglucosamine mutase [Prevotellaceae bacterium]
PHYEIVKHRIDLKPDTNIDAILESVKQYFKDEKVTDIDGVKIDFPTAWVHLRRSNTEPIIRVYAEASTEQEANELAENVIGQVKALM